MTNTNVFYETRKHGWGQREEAHTASSQAPGGARAAILRDRNDGILSRRVQEMDGPDHPRRAQKLLAMATVVTFRTARRYRVALTCPSRRATPLRVRGVA
jgi:hypothetical protein